MSFLLQAVLPRSHLLTREFLRSVSLADTSKELHTLQNTLDATLRNLAAKKIPHFKMPFVANSMRMKTTFSYTSIDLFHLCKHTKALRRLSTIRPCLSLLSTQRKNPFRSGRTLHTDVLIAGGGVMGSSTAYFLKSKSPNINVTVIEKDPTYLKASTTLSVSSIRQQFSIKENILLSMWSYKFLSNCSKHLLVPGQDAPDAQLKKGGYFFMATDAGRDVLTENFELQRSLGAKVSLLDSGNLAERFPWLNTDGISLGCVGTENEGWFDPWSLLLGFRKKAISIGVKYIHAEVANVKLDDSCMVTGADIVDPNNGNEMFKISCNKFLNAAGPWAGYLVQPIGVDLPVRPRKRYVFAFDCPKGPKDMLLAVDPSGCWFRKEGSGSLYICGKSPNEDNDPDSTDLEVDYEYFENEIWPNIAERVPAFEELKVQHSWAGFYDYNTFDQNGIVGAHPDISNLYFVNGFSGHGIQQSPAVGNAVSELMLYGKFLTIDLERFSFDRIISGTPLKEKNIV